MWSRSGIAFYSRQAIGRKTCHSLPKLRLFGKTQLMVSWCSIIEGHQSARVTRIVKLFCSVEDNTCVIMMSFFLVGDMMMSLLWYYRPEHLESGRRSDDMSDEVYASRHRDNTSVACIEDKCYVMTFNEYCR